MRKLTITGPRSAEIVRVSDPDRLPGMILVAPLRVGVCATDRELFEGTLVHLRSGMARYPITPGHEWVGRVLSSDESRLPVGSLVVGECSIGCGRCSACTAGSYHLCADRTETGIIRRDGALSEVMSFPAASAHVVPDSVRLEDAALIEPTAVAYRAIRRLDPSPGSRVLVLGAGTLGRLSAALLSQVEGCDVAVADPRPDAVERLAHLGVRHAQPDEVFPFVLEAAGHPDAVTDAVRRLAPGGRLVLVGLSGEPTVPLPADAVVVGDHTVLGSIGSPHVWPEVISIVARGLVSPGDLVTHVLGLDEFETALELARTVPGVGKVLIELNEAGNTAKSH